MNRRKVEEYFLSLTIMVGIVGFFFRMSYDLTGNFHPRKIFVHFPVQQEKQLPSKELQQVFNQKFTYLNLGHHVFAFESEDKKYVLKFFRLNKFRHHFWLKLPFFKKKNQQIAKEKKERLNFLLYSHTLVQQSLQQETGVYYLHLGKSDQWKQTVTLVDCWGREFSVPLGQQLFVLQKKFLLYKDRLPELIEKNQTDKVKKLIQAYFVAIGSRFAKGFVNKDRRGWGKNYAVVNDEIAYEIDLGGYDRAKETDSFAWELKQCSRDFRRWILLNAKEYLSFFDQEMQKAINISPHVHACQRDMLISQVEKP